MLFSEPKIPQSMAFRGFKGLNKEFQCSSASRKFLNIYTFIVFCLKNAVSVLFSEPKIPQFRFVWWLGKM